MIKKTFKVLIEVIAIDYYCFYIDNITNKITRKNAAKKQDLKEVNLIKFMSSQSFDYTL